MRHDLFFKTYVDLTNVEDFTVADETLLKEVLHGSPENIICLIK